MSTDIRQLGKPRDREMDKHIRELEETKRQYLELIYAVARKFPGETRHQTALRYIREREDEAASGTNGCVGGSM